MDDIKNHARTNGTTYMINLFGSIIPIITFLVYASVEIDKLATEDEVNFAIRTHMNAGAHPASVEMDEKVQKQLNNILSLQIEERIEKTVKVICQDPELRPQLEPTIKSLIQQYESITKRQYNRPSCAALGVS